MLEQGDIDALMAALSATQETAVRGTERSYSEVRIYDFAQPDNLPSEFLRALDPINASYARTLAGALTGHLLKGVTIEPISVEQMTYRNFCHAVPETTVAMTHTLTPLSGTGLIELNPHLAWYIIEIGLGQSGEGLDTQQDFTALERGMLEDLFRRFFLREYCKAWEFLCPIHASARELITNPTLARVAQPDDRMLVCSFNVTLPGVTGMSSYAIPVSSLDFERLLTRGQSWSEEGVQGMLEREQDALRSTMQQIEVPVRACLHPITIPLGELAALQVGDVIHLDCRVDDPVEVSLANVKQFYARPITQEDRVAVEICEEIVEE